VRYAATLTALVLLTGCASDEAERHAFDHWLQIDRSTYRAANSAATDVAKDAHGVTSPAPSVLELEEKSTLDDYLAYAAVNNPELEAAFYRWTAALQRAPQARALPDPMLNYRYFVQNVETRVGPQRHRIGLTQTLPWFGKRQLRSDMALQEAHAAHARYESMKLDLFYRIRRAYCERYYLGQAIQVVRENAELVRYLEQVALARFRVAAGEHPDVIRAQVELGRLDNQLETLRERLGPSAAALNAAMNRPVESPLPVPETLPEDVGAVDEPALADRLEWLSPKLVELRYQAALHRKGVALARLDEYPDVTLGLDYIETGDALSPGPSDSGQDAVALGFAINLPLDDTRRTAAVNEHLARFQAANRDRVGTLNALLAELDDAVYRWRDAQRKASLYRDNLLPKADQSLKATEAAFRAGTSSFTDLIDAQRVLLEFGLTLQRALTDQAIQRARIESLVPPVETDNPAQAEGGRHGQ
jgi:outer membrane protein TolC